MREESGPEFAAVVKELRGALPGAVLTARDAAAYGGNAARLRSLWNVTTLAACSPLRSAASPMRTPKPQAAEAACPPTNREVPNAR